MKAQSKYKFPGTFKIHIDTDEKAVTSFVAGTHHFYSESALERHINRLAKEFKRKSLNTCTIRVEQV